LRHDKITLWHKNKKNFLKYLKLALGQNVLLDEIAAKLNENGWNIER